MEISHQRRNLYFTFIKKTTVSDSNPKSSLTTLGFFMTNVRNVAFLGDFCATDICWSVHAASLCSIVGVLLQVCTIFASKRILFRTKYKSEECVSLSHYVEETQML